MRAGSKLGTSLQAWLQVTLMATVGSFKTVGPMVVVAQAPQAPQAQRLGAFTVSWISHVDWPPSVAPSARGRQG